MKKVKTCTKCGESKPLLAFSRHRLTKDGYAYQCKECNEKRAKKWRKTPSGVYNTIKGRQEYLNRHNDSRSKPFSITKEDFIKWYVAEPKTCRYCEIPENLLHLVAEKYGSRWKRLTIDCKDNELGYVKENLVLSCDKCNITKNNMLTYEEMLYIGQNFIKPKWKALIQNPKKVRKTEELRETQKFWYGYDAHLYKKYLCNLVTQIKSKGYYPVIQSKNPPPTVERTGKHCFTVHQPLDTEIVLYTEDELRQAGVDPADYEGKIIALAPRR